jgi:SAM-dependent methyltransferase
MADDEVAFALAREAEEDAARLRREGVVPVHFDHLVTEGFRALTPTRRNERSFGRLIEEAASVATPDINVPVASEIPGGSLVKATVRRAVGFYIRYMAQQATRFAAVSLEMARVLDDRLARLERALPAVARVVPAAATGVSAFLEQAGSGLEGVPGRVAVVECGDGALVGRLVGRGLDVFGVEPDEEAAARAEAAGWPVVVADGLDFLRHAEDGSLSGALVVGLPERLLLGQQAELVAELGRVVRRGGRVILVLTTPLGWLRAGSPRGRPAEAPLGPSSAAAVGSEGAPGGATAPPVPPAAWARLLELNGFRLDRTEAATPGDATEPGPGPIGHGPAERASDAAPLDELAWRVARLEALLLGPTQVALVATRRE